MNSIDLMMNDLGFRGKFSIYNRVTFVVGDSGCGKSTLVDHIARPARPDAVECLYNIVIMDSTNWRQVIKGSTKSILISDDESFIETEEFLSMLYDYTLNNDLYFILIGRDLLDSFYAFKGEVSTFPLAIDAIVHIIFKDNFYSFEQYFNSTLVEYSDVKSILVEDTYGGFEWFKYVSDRDVLSSYGNVKVIPTLEESSKDNILVIPDAANFGAYISRLDNKIIELGKSIWYFVDYPCFEGMLANTIPYLQYTVNDINDASYMCSDFNKEQIYECLIQSLNSVMPFNYYHGKPLPVCFKQECTECSKYIRSKCTLSVESNTSKWRYWLLGTLFEHYLRLFKPEDNVIGDYESIMGKEIT